MPRLFTGPRHCSTSTKSLVSKAEREKTLAASAGEALVCAEALQSRSEFCWSGHLCPAVHTRALSFEGERMLFLLAICWLGICSLESIHCYIKLLASLQCLALGDF